VDTAIIGSFFCISLPVKGYERGMIQIDNKNAMQIATWKADSLGGLMKISASRLKIKTGNREITVQSTEKGMIFLRRETKNKETGLVIYFQLQTGSLHAGDKEEKIFAITAPEELIKMIFCSLWILTIPADHSPALAETSGYKI
jgi:hypothetical protein